MVGFRWEEKNKARKWSLSLLTSAYVSIAGQLCLWPLDCELLKDSTRYVLPLEWIWHLGSCRHERTSMFLWPDGLLKINTSDSWSVQELSVLLWLWSRPSSSIGRHSLMSIFSSSTFFDFLLEGRSESWVFAMTYTFPLLLAKCNCLISGRANRVATYRSRLTLSAIVTVCGVKKKDWSEHIDRTRGLLPRAFDLP